MAANGNDSVLTINTYDANNRITTSLFQTWQSDWVDDSRTNYGTLHEIITQNWDGSAWINDTRITLSYTSGCALPVTLLDFTSTLNGKVAQLK